MHRFSELIDQYTDLMLTALKEIEARSLDALQSDSDSSLVKTLQMANLHRVISVVGMFSIFDALLQDQLGESKGFDAAQKVLDTAGEEDLSVRFNTFQLAINVLKHGVGWSYRDLLKKPTLPFKIKQPHQNFFDEGDMGEVQALIFVDDSFVINCANTIREVSEALRRIRPDFYI
jgi:hypothetical protein